jgi:hypothetical protein
VLGILFVIASLIFLVAVIIGANIWAVREPRTSELERSLTELINEISDAGTELRPSDRNRLNERDGPS